jgi:hypothetical protein
VRRRWAALIFSSLLLPGCAAASTPAPPPFSGAPPGPPGEVAEASPPPAEASPPVPAATAVAGPPSPPGDGGAPSAPAPARPIITLEPGFRLDRRVIPPTRAAFLAGLAERTRWNQGGMGPLAAPVPPVPGHPAPKVILDVVRVKGALQPAEAQRALRRNFWMKTVECFSLGAYKDPSLRGTASLVIGVSAAGKVGSARVTRTSFTDDEVNHCLAERIRTVVLPKARSGSNVSIDLQLGHGDMPVPPPPSLVVPGEGELSPEAIRAVVEAALPAFEACYRPALEYAPELWGRLGVRFHVTEKGQTDEAFEVESRFPDERVSLCVLRAARKLAFPRPANGDLRFVVPLRFGVEKPPAAAPAP